MAVKLCTNCGEEKDSIKGFHKEKTTKDGRHRHCKVCRNKVNKEWQRKQRVIKKNAMTPYFLHRNQMTPQGFAVVCENLNCKFDSDTKGIKLYIAKAQTYSYPFLDSLLCADW